MASGRRVGQRPDCHTFLCKFWHFQMAVSQWKPAWLTPNLGILWISVSSFWLCESIVANPIIYRLVPRPSRFETRQSCNETNRLGKSFLICNVNCAFPLEIFRVVFTSMEVVPPRSSFSGSSGVYSTKLHQNSNLIIFFIKPRYLSPLSRTKSPHNRIIVKRTKHLVFAKHKLNWSEVGTRSVNLGSSCCRTIRADHCTVLSKHCLERY